MEAKFGFFWRRHDGVKRRVWHTDQEPYGMFELLSQQEFEALETTLHRWGISITEVDD